MMARIQQSIDIQIPVRKVYNQLTQFEEYPRFMEDLQAVDQLNDTDLHWTVRVSNRNVEWDSVITEQVPDRCIEWNNTQVPSTTSRIDVQPVGTGATRVTITLALEPEQVPDSPAGFGEDDMAQRLRQDLTRLKKLIEAQESESGAWRGEIHEKKVTTRGRDAKRAAPVQTSSFGAGSEGWDGSEDPSAPVMSATAKGSSQSGENAPAAGATPQPARTTQPDYSLSQPESDSSGDQQFSIAEEVSFDQQSDEARRIGEMPEDIDAAATNPGDAMTESMKPEDDADSADGAGNGDRKKIKDSIERAVPPAP